MYTYMATAATLLYVQRWKESEISAMEEWLVKMTKSEEMAKFTCLVQKKIITAFVSYWKPFTDFAGNVKELVIYGFHD